MIEFLTYLLSSMVFVICCVLLAVVLAVLLTIIVLTIYGIYCTIRDTVRNKREIKELKNEFGGKDARFH